MPPKYAEIEEMTEPWMPFYITAFMDLETERAIGMGLGPIPWFTIRAYGEVHGLRGQDLQNFLTVIRIMDNAVMRDRNKDK